MKKIIKKQKSTIHFIVGARPNFIKLAPLYNVFKKKKIDLKIIHTGQHHEVEMSKIFFENLKIPNPTINLNINNKTHGEMTGKIMIKYEQFININYPDLVVVFGDVNSTLACALVAKKLQIKVAHVESGLRSRDTSMPEELNRIIVDKISDLLFVPSKDAINNLLKEGIDKKKIKFVGNVMIDNIVQYKKHISENNILNKLLIKKNDYCLLTIHRPENVDNLKDLKKLFIIINKISSKILIVFPIHPRTKKAFSINGIDIKKFIKNIIITKPLNYIETQKLIKDAKFVITDSGGIQEETSFHNTPCLTYRKNTERPITISHGTNILVSKNNILKNVNKLLYKRVNKKKKITYWDGKASSRIKKEIEKIL